jgi:hypothetical protein
MPETDYVETIPDSFIVTSNTVAFRHILSKLALPKGNTSTDGVTEL